MATTCSYPGVNTKRMYNLNSETLEAGDERKSF